MATPVGRTSPQGLCLALVGAALITGGCTTLGPDYTPPEVPWLEKWQPSLYGQIDTTAAQEGAELRFWWRLFNDPRLNALIAAAEENNPSLRIAGLRILEARAQLGIASSALYPQVQQLTGGTAYVHRRQSDRAQDLASYDTSFNLSWELDFWGRFRRAVESADAAFFASIANRQNLQVLLNAQVADLYFTYWVTKLRIAVARENARLQQRSYDITRQLYHSGATSELDLQQAKAQYLATLSGIPQLEIALTKTRNALATLLGRPPGEMPELQGEHYRLPELQPVRIRDIPARLLLRRPDVRSAAWQVAAQSAQIGIAEAEFYPAISLLGSIGWSGTRLSGAADTGSLGLGPAFRWNIFDYGRIKNSVRLQDARLQQSIEQYQDTVLQAARELDDAAISVVKTAEQRQTLEDSLAAARRSLELATTRYREGYADFQRVLDAQRAVAAQADRALANRGEHLAAVIAFYKALGGGWLDTPVQGLIPEQTRETMRQRTDWGDLLRAPLPTVPAPTTRETKRHE